MKGNSMGLSSAKKVGYKKIMHFVDITKRKFDYRLKVVKA
jgi:hypothetical protein